ncbi:DUF2946 domain-containing protein [Paraburkholderia atlantica]|uniref:DUF2946 domain-containing protein n=1 Tax=Paraburkholderia atlantica TaxID=2654982 RepID=UPI003D1F6D46
MTDRSRTHLTAWPGLLAMWLIVFAPIVSQLVERAHSHQSTAVTRMEMNVSSMHMLKMHMHMGISGGDAGDCGHHASKPTMAACGYCNLLATHATVPALEPAQAPVHMFLMFSAALVLCVRFTPTGAFPAGRPRAPPVLS